MRRTLLALLAAAALAGAAALVAPSPAGGQAEGQSAFSFEIIKDVHGDGPTSGFVIAYECIDDKSGILDSGTLNFDNIVDGHETQLIQVQGFAVSCSVTEVDSNGADLVEYECEFFPAADAPDAAEPEGSLGSCIDDQTAGHFHNNDFGSFLVRNTFDPEVLPDDEEPPPAVNPDVVTATPSFTG